MNELISINRTGVFSLEEVRQVLPVIRKITQEISDEVDSLIQQIEATASSQKGTISVLENEINNLILIWNQKIKKLGAIPKGLWLVDFEFGRGYYCWKHPETDIYYWHTQGDGYSGRRPLEELSFEKAKEKVSANSNRSGPNQRPTRRL